MNKKHGKVFVAMSGGVDSAVAAALLKRDGFSVVGVFMKCWNATGPFGKSCTAPDDERSARLAAERLDIPFYSWNFVKEYRAKVVDYMLEGYKNGITPNPDMMCNKEIKFGLFFEKAMNLGADHVATGHYARLRREYQMSNDKCQMNVKVQNSNQHNRIILLEGVDKNKDQSYFLGMVRSEALERVLFPVGEYTKPQVRELARKFGLPNAERKESQGVCFIGKLDFAEFLKARIHEEPGEIRDEHGKVVGKHRGLSLCTIGQRKGIGLSGGPYYVTGKDGKTNTLFVSKNENDLLSKTAIIYDINWFIEPPKDEMKIGVKIRYRQKLASAVLMPSAGRDDSYVLAFDKSQRAVTPGQFAVLYDKETVLGAGIIQ